MKLTFAAMAAAVLSHATPATAASLCNCCGSTTSQSCTNACAPVKPVDGQCVATVDYEGAAEISTSLNPFRQALKLISIWNA